MFGGWTTLWLLNEKSPLRTIALPMAVGLLTIGVATLLSYGYLRESGGLLSPLTIPHSKWFFSVPYCLLSAGTGMMLYAFCWLLFDGWRFERLAFPLRVFGLNAIVLYVGSGLVFKAIVAKWTVQTPDGSTANLASGLIAWISHGTGSPIVGSYAWPAVWIGLWWLVLLWVHQRRVYVRV